jgi:putative restriction endonuclease
MVPRSFGEIADIPEGTAFDTREALNIAGIHRPTQAGISGAATEGADSIVLSMNFCLGLIGRE